MGLSVISFTENGMRLSMYLEKELEMDVHLYVKCKAVESSGISSVTAVKTSVGEWAGEQMKKKNALLFIGACGIAVRAVAPFLTDKLKDAPVLVMDECERYVIPILAGHMGGGNALAAYIAKKTKAAAVITTATDIRKKFAVDLFAKKNGLFLVNRDGIAKVSAKALADKEITISVETGHCQGDMDCPYGVRILPYPPAEPVDVLVTSREEEFYGAVRLRPREYVIGIGCKKGKSEEEIADFITKRLGESGICITQIYAVASIAQKRGEQGIVAWCQRERLPFLTYEAGELMEAAGDFTKSSFVMSQVGVDNVCERAALLACGDGGVLTAKKFAENGMTLALAKREWRVRF